MVIVSVNPLVAYGIVGYDANALYPSVMRDGKFPDPLRIRRYSPSLNTIRQLIDHDNLVCAADIDIRKPEGVMGMLAGKDDAGRKDWTVSEFSGWMCEPEIRLALEIGYEITSVREVMGAQACNPFRDFVEEMYALRMQMREDGDPAHSMVKLAMNSLFGRFAIKEKPTRIEGSEGILKAQESNGWPDRYEIRFHDGHEQYQYLLDMDSLTRAPSSQYFGFSSFILSYGRERLMRAILAAGDGFLYSDTDSVYMLEEYREQFESQVSIGDELGQWKLETPEPIFKGTFWEPKCYFFENEEGEKVLVKHKGVSVRGDDGEYLDNAGDLTKPQRHKTIVSLYEALRRGLDVGIPMITEKKSARYYQEP